MTQAVSFRKNVADAVLVQEMLDAWEDAPPEQGRLPDDQAQRLETLVQLAVRMATGLTAAWRTCLQEGSGWETGFYLRRMRAVEDLARVMVDILTRTQEIVTRTCAIDREWVAPRAMAEMQSNLPAAQAILADVGEQLVRLRRRTQVNEATPESSAASTVAETFQNLASRWKRETRFCSSRTKMVDHPAYQEIIGMGAAVLPLILGELRTDPRYWFSALHAITGEDPVPAEHRGSVRKMTDAWLEWGKVHGY